MLSADQIAANRKTLTSLLVNQMNLPTDASAWTYDQRIAYNKAFAAYILAHPGSFGDQDVQTAQGVTAENPTALDDTSLSSDLAAFGSDVVDNVSAAGAKVAGIGTGVLDLASLMKYIIPVAGVLVAGILIYSFYKKEAAK